MNTLSFDLRWLSPTDARRLLALALERGIAVREGESIRPAFDPAAIVVPVGWRATSESLDEPAGAVAFAPPAAPGAPPPLLARAADITGVPTETIAREAEAERERAVGLLGQEAAIVLAVARRGHDARELARLARTDAA